MNSDNRGKWFYAHAGGLADVQFIFEEIVKNRSYSVSASFSGSSAIIAHIRKQGGKNAWHFIDSYWLFRDSLAAIARSIGMEKTGPKALDGASQADIKHWYATTPMSELIPYNRNDCVILWEAINAFQHRILEAGGQLQMTIASCAMHLFRRKYLKNDVGTHKLVNDTSRKGYFASRVEVFNARCDAANYYDINSSFPYAMTEPVPGEFVKTTRALPDNPDKLYMADVEFTIPDCYLPPIPTRVDGRLFFPTGTWRSWLSGIDCRLIEEEGGTIIKVHEVYHFDAITDLREYALDIYQQRKQAQDPFDKLVLKYLLNSLYGKFAERRAKDKMIVFPDLKTLERLKARYDKEELDSMQLMPGIYIEEIDTDVQHEHVPISVYITARARKTLYNYLAYSRHAFYCDTDGFCTTDEYATGPDLGQLKLEKTITSADFIAPKVYKLHGQVLGKSGWEDQTIVKAKGFSLGRGAESVKRFDALVAGEEIEIERMARIREELTRAGRKNAGFSPRETTFYKAFRDRLITKRHHYPDGYTRPWHIDELKGK